MQTAPWPYGNYIGPGRFGLSAIWQRIWDTFVSKRKRQYAGRGPNAKPARVCPTMYRIEQQRKAKVS